MNCNASSRLVSVGSYLPKTRVTTQELLDEIGHDKFGVSQNHIESLIGVSEVRHSDFDQLPSQLAFPAAQSALEQCIDSVNPDHIDLIIFCGIEGDYVEPSTAHVIQALLGLKSGICFDIQNACLGFMSALQIADSMIAAGAVRYALVCTGEKGSKLSKSFMRVLSQSSCKQFFSKKIGMLTVGDAGGAAIIGPQQEANGGFMNFGTDSKGQYTNLCYYRPRVDGQVEGQMDMGKICSVVLNTHKQIFEDTLSHTGWASKDIDCLISHQVGAKPFSLLSEMLEVPETKMVRTYNRFGNLTTATFPVNMAIGIRENKIRPKSKLWAAMAGSGISVCHVGFTVP